MNINSDLRKSGKSKKFYEAISFLVEMEGGEEYANFLNKEEQIKNNSPKDIREIKRLLCRCLNSGKVQEFSLRQWGEIVELPSVFASLTFSFRFTSDGVILTGVDSKEKGPNVSGGSLKALNTMVKQSVSRGR